MYTIAVYTSDDSNHAIHTDEAVLLDSPSDFTNGSKLVAICLKVKADFVHPGYGFLSENAEFAEALNDAGIGFVGPSSNVLRQTSDKTDARSLAEASHVPVLPALGNAISNLDEAEEFIGRVGFPLMIKAVDGGRGRGIRLVQRL